MELGWRWDAKEFWGQAINSFKYRHDWIEDYCFKLACRHFHMHRLACHKIIKLGWFADIDNSLTNPSELQPAWEVAQENWDSFLNNCRLLKICNPVWEESPWPICEYFVPPIDQFLPGFQKRDPMFKECLMDFWSLQEMLRKECGADHG